MALPEYPEKRDIDILEAFLKEKKECLPWHCQECGFGQNGEEEALRNILEKAKAKYE